MNQLVEATTALLERAYRALTPDERNRNQGSIWLKNVAIALQGEVDPDDLPEDTADAVRYFAEAIEGGRDL